MQTMVICTQWDIIARKLTVIRYCFTINCLVQTMWKHLLGIIPSAFNLRMTIRLNAKHIRLLKKTKREMSKYSYHQPNRQTQLQGSRKMIAWVNDIHENYFSKFYDFKKSSLKIARNTYAASVRSASIGSRLLISKSNRP